MYCSFYVDCFLPMAQLEKGYEQYDIVHNTVEHLPELSQKLIGELEELEDLLVRGGKLTFNVVEKIEHISSTLLSFFHF